MILSPVTHRSETKFEEYFQLYQSGGTVWTTETANGRGGLTRIARFSENIVGMHMPFLCLASCLIWLHI